MIFLIINVCLKFSCERLSHEINIYTHYSWTFLLQELFENELLYELYAVIVHKGTVECGHYYAFVNTSRQCNKEKWDRLTKESRVDEDILKSKLERIFEEKCAEYITKTNDELPKIESDWYFVSDENIAPETTETVLNQNDAYILFYEAKTYTDGYSQTYCCSTS